MFQTVEKLKVSISHSDDQNKGIIIGIKLNKGVVTLAW